MKTDMSSLPALRYFWFWLIILSINLYGQEGPLGEWPDFEPIGFITAPHPQNPNVQTHLYGDWGGIVGEEFLSIQDSILKLFYHSYHATYLTQHLNKQNILEDWELGYDPVTHVKYTPLVSPGGPYPGPAWSHTDTPGYIQHPVTDEHLLYHTVRPGTKYLKPEWSSLPGWEGAIQVATSDSFPEIGMPFEQGYENILFAELWWENGWNQNGTIKGGLSEPTPVWIPHLGESGKIRLFYRGLNGSPGSYWNWRISYADSEDGKTNWVKNPTPSWDPSIPGNPAYQWTLPSPQGFSFRGAWQAHCTGDTIADGVHMVLCVSNQNYAGYGHIAYYWSPDWGDTWIGHPDNPIIAPGQFPNGVPSQGFQRTPAIVVDNVNHRYILVYNAGHDMEEPWKRRTYVATASRPLISSVEQNRKKERNYHVYPNPASSLINIEGDFKGPIKFEIHSLLGVKLVEGMLTTKNNQIDLTELSPNIYVLLLESRTYKIIKTK
ncbi:MAG: T9SS type A sorting domain-containing protein [Bacteroidales bacterium]|nr:T9SS type A sorting domain-containing protein [Bacteroidales bacterium]MCF8403152.1 T9SS type A sorting domain-containing protein [Bacteroidales bacterium]